MNILVLLVLAFVAAANSQGTTDEVPVFSTVTSGTTDEPPVHSGCGNPAIRPVFPSSPGSLIVGGTKVVKGSYPWQANLRVTPRRGDEYQFCGGTLINNQWVLTAGHCWYGTKDADLPDYRVGLGYFHVDGKGDESQSQTVGISKQFMHENYDDYTLANDICLLKLDKPVTFDDNVHPACLPTMPVQDACTATPIITGWGDTENTATEPEYMQQVQVPYIDSETCNQRSWYNGEVFTEMFCAGFAEGGKDTCQGDSGGPLVCTQADDLFYVAGITSWGYGCADPRNPGIYTRVAYFRSWIDNIINNN